MLTYKEIKPRLDSLARSAQSCRNKNKITSCNNCKHINNCTIQTNYEKWLIKSRKAE